MACTNPTPYTMALIETPLPASDAIRVSLEDPERAPSRHSQVIGTWKPLTKDAPIDRQAHSAGYSAGEKTNGALVLVITY